MDDRRDQDPDLDTEPEGEPEDEPEDNSPDGAMASRPPDVEPEPWDLEFEPVIGPRISDGPAPGVVHAELPLRAATLVVDLLIAQFLAGVVTRVGLEFLQYQINTSWFGPSPDFSRAVVVFTGALAWTVSAAAYVYFVRRLRSSPGQLFLGLFTLRVDGRRLGVSTALLRWLLIIWPVLISGPVGTVLSGLAADPDFQATVGWVLGVLPWPWLTILAVTILRDPKGRGLHDRVTHSVVVRRAGSPA